MTSSQETVPYFGYGAMRSREMMSAVIGRRPSGIQATIDGYELIIQKLPDIPLGIREDLGTGWGSDYRAYRLRPTEKIDPWHSVTGVVWDITPEERKLVENFEVNGLWVQTVSVEALTIDRSLVQAVSDAVPIGSTGEVVDSYRYGPFLNDRGRMIEVAKLVRESFLREDASQRER